VNQGYSASARERWLIENAKINQRERTRKGRDGVLRECGRNTGGSACIRNSSLK